MQRVSTKRLFTLLVPILVLGLTGSAEANDALKGKTYYFGMSEARTNVTFVSEADLETIHGVTHKMEGNVAIDATGKAGKGTIRVAVNTLQTGIALRDQHLRSSTWMDSARFPWVRLELTKLTEGKDGKTWAWSGKLTVKGVTKEITGSAAVRAIPDALGRQLGNGSWVRVRTKFDVKLSDHGIAIPSQVGSKVSAVWKVNVDLYGSTSQR